MIKVYLDNGDIVECKESLAKAASMLIDKKGDYIPLEKTDGVYVIVNTNKVSRIESSVVKETSSEVEPGPFSEDIVVE